MQAVTFFFAFVSVLALIGVAAWFVRRFASNRLAAGTNRGGRMPRLAVIDATAVDGRRRLVLVRRDNIEHLLMIGGPADIVVESNIVRASPARDQLSQRPGVTAPELLRITPDTARSELEAARGEEPQMPEAPLRPMRPSFAEELRRPASTASERRTDPLTSFAPEPMGRLEPRPEPRLESRSEPRHEPVLPRVSRTPRASESPKPPRAAERAAAPPPPPPLPQPTPPSTQNADQNLAEMAQRLEAALRRPAASANGDSAPPVAPEEPPHDRGCARSEQPMGPPEPSPTSFENLEDEMASLLGRPKSSSS
jgi:flagellar biogenesis protein FliO